MIAAKGEENKKNIVNKNLWVGAKISKQFRPDWAV